MTSLREDLEQLTAAANELKQAVIDLMTPLAGWLRGVFR